MAREMEVDSAMRGKLPSRHLDEVIARLVAAQHDVVARRQLLAESFSRHAIDRAVRRRRLHRVLTGVYSVSPRPGRNGWWMAAVLAAGPGAVLSHRAAAALHGIRPFDGLEVTTPRDRRIPRLIIHRAELPEDERTEVDGIPTTGPSRTIFDLAAVLPKNHLERALRRAETDRIGDSLSLAEVFARHPRARGTRKLRQLLRDGAFTALTRSELEDEFLEKVRAAGLPMPETNVLVAGFEADAVWRDRRLIAEIDSLAFHRDPEAFERDRRRDRVLARAGWTVVRVTHRQLADSAVMADLGALLGRPSMSTEDRDGWVR